jgi:hypothetical protein
MAGVPTGTGYSWTEIANPWTPVIDQATSGIADVILSLEGIDPEWMKPWDLPNVTCEAVASRLHIRQGDSTMRRVGIVRVGDEVPFQSGDAGHHMLRARGSAFFTLPFPEPRKPLPRRFEKPGIVELSSGAGYYWHAADLLVVTHPYHAVSDSTGSFTFLNVPPGMYSLIARARNWHVVNKERDPETGLIFRQSYAPPVEVRIPVTIRSNEPTLTSVLVPASQFQVR